jgi:alkylhydroperoxidase/carboxymuconolactone decarboxylase family protein YurZ
MRCFKLLVRSALVAGLATALIAAQAVLAAAPAGGPAVAWRNAAADADIEIAFAQARAETKPLLLY